MLVLCANLVYLSFDRTGNQAVEGGLYKRYLKERKKGRKKRNSKGTSESGIGVAELQANCASVDAHGILSV